MRSWLSAAQQPEESLAARAAVLATAVIAGLGMVLTAGAPITVAISLTVVAAGHVVSWRGRHRRRTIRGQAVIGALVVACLTYLLLDLILAVFGGALPQAKFAVMTMAVTSFDLKSRRNLFSHVWHSAAILYVGALFAWDYAYVGVLLLWAAGFFAFLLFTRRGSRILTTRPAVRKALLSSGRRALPWLAVWVVVGAVLFVGLPRVAGRPVAVPVLVSIPLSQNASGEVLPAVLPLVGTAPEGGQEASINLRVRGRLGDQVMFRVRAPASSYWRSYVLEKYEGQSWSRVAHPAKVIPPISSGLPIRDENTITGPGLPQTFYIERPLPAEVVASYPLRELYFPASNLVLVDSGIVNTPFGLRKGVNYSAVSQVRDLSPTALRAANPLTGREASVDLQLPSGVPSRVHALALRLTAGQPTEYDKVRSVVDYLQQGYPYSLDTPRLPSGADAVDQFLFVDRVGFCEQFASALSVLLREVGIPSRMAIGYGTGDHDTLTGTFTVRARDAHAWVEVLFPGVGWVPFDASPGFDSTPFAHAPPRWFLSDFSPQVALTSLGATTPRALGLGLGALALALAALLAVWWRRRRLVPPELRAYRWALRWVRWAGLPDRAPPQTPAEHWRALMSLSPSVAGALAPVRAALEDAIYRDARGPAAGHWRVAAAALRHRMGR
ncbi:MAG TPA: transglutaminaseTgpA domain-containing protein [Candidatus Dormibacteraeota bacterium]|jgi:transglutaminase-like putative cysteine protease|nr:transglutaminaseTgpA domain-containing protein [Candidatus Dormibacteraeota bacterium]